MPNETLINDIISEARTYLGVPWKHQGRSRKGVDCVGYLLLAFSSKNILINEIKGYSRKPDGIKLKEIMDSQPNFNIVSFGKNIKVGDILLLKIRKDPQHVALVTPSSTSSFGMIHSYNGGQKKVIEHDLAPYWKEKIVSIYRLKDNV